MQTWVPPWTSRRHLLRASISCAFFCDGIIGWHVTQISAHVEEGEGLCNSGSPRQAGCRCFSCCSGFLVGKQSVRLSDEEFSCLTAPCASCPCSSSILFSLCCSSVRCDALSVKQYFTGPGVLHIISCNIIAGMQYDLPGVFQSRIRSMTSTGCFGRSPWRWAADVMLAADGHWSDQAPKIDSDARPSWIF